MEILDLCKSGDKQGIDSLLKDGANPNAADEKGRTCLHFAASIGKGDVVKTLIEHGADVMNHDNLGNTALHYSGHTDVVQCLYDHGADLNARNFHGDTAMVLMQRKRIDESTITLLENLLQDNIAVTNAESSRPLLAQRTSKPNQVQSVLMEFCKDLGVFYLLLLLIIVSCLSLFVAFVVTGLAQTDFSRIPVVDGETFHKTEL